MIFYQIILNRKAFIIKEVFGLEKFFESAQSSIEVIIILSVGLVTLLVFLSIVLNHTNALYHTQQQQIALQTVRTLAREADNIHFSGDGSKNRLLLTVPDAVDFSKSEIENNTFVLNVGGSEVFSTAKTEIRGVWPNAPGQYLFILESFGDFVSLSSRKVSLHQSLTTVPREIEFLIAPDDVIQESFLVCNNSVNTISGLDKTIYEEGVSISATGFVSSLNPKYCEVIDLNIESSPSTGVFYNYLTIFNNSLSTTFSIVVRVE